MARLISRFYRNISKRSIGRSLFCWRRDTEEIKRERECVKDVEEQRGADVGGRYIYLLFCNIFVQKKEVLKILYLKAVATIFCL
jgi:hypothetical protein